MEILRPHVPQIAALAGEDHLHHVGEEEHDSAVQPGPEPDRGGNAERGPPQHFRNEQLQLPQRRARRSGRAAVGRGVAGTGRGKVGNNIRWYISLSSARLVVSVGLRSTALDHDIFMRDGCCRAVNDSM